MRLIAVSFLIVVMAAIMPPFPTIYEDGSFVYMGQQGCLPWAICAEGE
jgi:hypothetical protein